MNRNLRSAIITFLCISLAIGCCAIRQSSAAEPTVNTTGSATHQASHDDTGDAVAFMVAIVVLLMAAKFGGEIAERVGQPAVLGELLIGVVIGGLYLADVHWFESLKSNGLIAVAAQIGAILLLFEVGLESRLKELSAVGLSSLFVACVGVVAPMFLGLLVGRTMLAEEPFLLHLFLGATLTATSVGISARVMRDLKKTNTKEARIVLGAAVIDDVLGLIVLTVVTGLITSSSSNSEQTFGLAPALIIITKTIIFLFASIVIGQMFAQPLMNALSLMRVDNVLLVGSLCICFTFASLAGLIGLAPIVGAFAAGLILEPSHYHRFTRRGERSIEELVSPVAGIFVPVFFVVMGMRVDVRSFSDMNTLGLAAALTLAAVLGKIVCGAAAIEKGLHRMIISIGMLPRGEVGLIFAGMGASLKLAGTPVVDSNTYSAIVIVVMLTTLITPVWLKALYIKADKKASVT